MSQCLKHCLKHNNNGREFLLNKFGLRLAVQDPVEKWATKNEQEFDMLVKHTLFSNILEESKAAGMINLLCFKTYSFSLRYFLVYTPFFYPGFETTKLKKKPAKLNAKSTIEDYIEQILSNFTMNEKCHQGTVHICISDKLHYAIFIKIVK